MRSAARRAAGTAEGVQAGERGSMPGTSHSTAGRGEQSNTRVPPTQSLWRGCRGRSRVLQRLNLAGQRGRGWRSQISPQGPLPPPRRGSLPFQGQGAERGAGPAAGQGTRGGPGGGMRSGGPGGSPGSGEGQPPLPGRVGEEGGLNAPSPPVAAGVAAPAVGGRAAPGPAGVPCSWRS